MKALKLVSPGKIELQEVPIPEIGADEVLIKVAGAGLCQSDLHILEMNESWPYFGGTMGHETAGYVDRLGSQVTGYKLGDAVLVSVIWGCGHCRACAVGRDNACAINGSRTQFPTTPGIGPDGGMAEYMKVRPRHLDKIGDLDPASAAPLADAGVTPMHAINNVRDRLTPDATAVVIGVGGLGHMALQILSATAGSRVVAVDTDESRLRSARMIGADSALRNDETTVSRILDETQGYGVDVVLDFVGTQDTIDMTRRIVAPEGTVQLIGLGGGTLSYPTGSDGPNLPWGVRFQRSYGGTRVDQLEVIALAQQGKATVHTVPYPLADASRAFDDLAQGRISGRAVLIP
jgi:propanol-preferring alcohol dehydrogenase